MINISLGAMLTTLITTNNLRHHAQADYNSFDNDDFEVLTEFPEDFQVYYIDKFKLKGYIPLVNINDDKLYVLDVGDEELALYLMEQAYFGLVIDKYKFNDLVEHFKKWN